MKTLIAAFFTAAVLVAPIASVTSPADAAGISTAKQSCTKTSSGSCIRGGQFCPKASYGKVGYDASHRKYKCKGDRSHPHWMK